MAGHSRGGRRRARARSRTPAVWGAVVVAISLAACGGAGPSSARDAGATGGGTDCAAPPAGAVPAGSTTEPGGGGAEVASHPGPALPPTWPASVRLPTPVHVLSTAVVVQPCGYELRANADAPTGAGAAQRMLVGALRSAGFRPLSGVSAGIDSRALGDGRRRVVLTVDPVGASQSFVVVAVPVGTFTLSAGAD